MPKFVIRATTEFHVDATDYLRAQIAIIGIVNGCRDDADTEQILGQQIPVLDDCLVRAESTFFEHTKKKFKDGDGK